MRLNAEFDKRAAVFASTMPWVPSPVAGVERRMLERIGDEVARASSLVRYAPGSNFSPHVHEAGEEFLVLEGIFHDEHGSYSAGTYVRNPPGTMHSPGSREGCVLLVKLRQSDPSDSAHVVLNSSQVEWSRHAECYGIRTLVMHRYGSESVSLEDWPAHTRSYMGAAYGDEYLVLEGEFQQQGQHFVRWDWLRIPSGESQVSTAGAQGCRLWRKSGHLK